MRRTSQERRARLVVLGLAAFGIIYVALTWHVVVRETPAPHHIRAKKKLPGPWRHIATERMYYSPIYTAE